VDEEHAALANAERAELGSDLAGTHAHSLPLFFEPFARLVRYPGMNDPQEIELERALALASVPIPEEIDRRMALAAAAAVRRRALRQRVGMSAGAFVMAAAAALALFLTRPAPLEARDVNRDGRFDVLDAHRLAREIAGGRTPSSWDFDGDGRVDGKDLDFVARQLVSVEKGAGG
jgi:hypothetical protein